MSKCNQQKLCDLGIYTREDAKKWMLKNHPDKSGGKVDGAIFGNVSQCNKDRIYCSAKQKTAKKVPYDNTADLRNEMFTCMRQTENFSKLRPEFRVDKVAFNVKDFNEAYIEHSPKLAQLLSIIKDLDENDMKTHGKLFKHFIYSDVKEQGYGVKVILAGLEAHGHKSIIKVKSGGEPTLSLVASHGNNSYAYLISTTIFQDTFTSKLKKQVLARFNARPTNVHGDDVRIIVLDSGFKEGIDLFDVKYVHIFEPSMTIADLKQTIGRATRTCGQRGLNFQPNVGWPLYVYNYFIVVPDHTKEALVAREPKLLNAPVADNKVFKEGTKFKDGIMYYSKFDKALVNLSTQLFELGPVLSVDYELTKNIHGTEEPTYMYDSEVAAIQMGGIGDRFNRVAVVKCEGKCGKKSTLDIPASVEFLRRVYLEHGHKRESIPKKESRAFFCKYMAENPEFCSQVNRAWATRTAAVPRVVSKAKTPKQAEDEIVASLDLVPIRDEDEPVYDIVAVKGHVDEGMKSKDGPAPPKRRIGFEKMRDYIRTNFGSKFKWSPIEVVNKCGEPPKGGAPSKDLSKIITFNPTQNFVSHYFTPESPYKGMLLWHSVGTGKTCTAIATATSSFEREGYTILWVTRTTLKSDIWKNMFDQICHTIIADRVRKGLELPDDDSARKRLLSKNWIQPMSYKQFSNLLSGENKMYEDLKKLNGAEDVVRKTLIIIDEAHKLYGGDLKVAERPDMEVMEKFLENSYKKSGKDSARLLIMTATPFTNSPMELFKLINLCIEDKQEKIPDDIKIFKQIYMDEDDLLSKSGSKKLANQLSGYISYLNREKDPTQFAQPIMIDVPVVMSAAPEDVRPFLYKEKKVKDMRAETKEILSEYKDRIAGLRATIKNAKSKTKGRNKTLRVSKKNAKDDCKNKYPGRKEKALRDKCVEEAIAAAEAEANAEPEEDIDKLEAELSAAISEKGTIADDSKKLTKKIRDAIKVRTKYQDVMLRERCEY
uniref:Helicase ATP-binding domain-containing protein n=1 Tax=viral metagenome TaxID=1070528 RepID=A0A6C0BX11_9ZZZZ